MQVQYPFIIHACPEIPAYPAHTHGLAEIGMPEFIMDPFAFGPNGNGSRINACYEYFIKPENANKLGAILNGQTIKLTDKDLKPDLDWDKIKTYCLREVPASFQAVKEAYGYGVSMLIPRMRFIQIYVEGDDFALTDEYYRGGVTY